MPAVDDGAPNLTYSLSALRAFAAQGVTTCLTTPHFDGSLTRDPAARNARLGEFDAAWDALLNATKGIENIPEIARGTEVMLDDPDPDLSDPRIRLAGGPFVLVEFPAMRLPPNADRALLNIRQRGWWPIVAHPERYRNHDDRLSMLMQCKAAGALLQVNAGSLLGQHGDRARAIARTLLDRGLADYIASDFHARGTPPVERALALLRERGGDLQVHYLSVENPRRILAGESPVAVPPMAASKGRSWWSRIFG